MRKIFFISTILLINTLASAQNYKASLIADSLKENAFAVIRYDEVKLTVKSIRKAIVKRKFAYTILHENADFLANYSGYYDKLRSVSDITGTLYDAEGNKIKTIKNKEIIDVAISDGFSLANDARAKRFSLASRNYPYTVEFEDEYEYDGIYNLPDWYPVKFAYCGIETSKFIVETPADYKMNYKLLHTASAPTVTTKSGITTYMWELKNYKPIEPEIWQPEWKEITPCVLISPVEFEYGGFKGNMSSWAELGKFGLQLNQGKDNLPVEVKNKVHTLTDNLTTTEEKVYTLYNYLQQNTRYISIQLGIGGLMPFDAKYVHEKKYGDCKALSNFMVSLLKEAGIRAHYCWVAAGEDEEKSVFADFPKDYFNHIITCVPNGKDTIWLECTSQTISPGYIGSFTGNRKALAITEEGGALVNTPNYTSKDNLQLRKVLAEIDKEGTLKAIVKTTFTGIQQELQHKLIHYYSEDERKKYLNNYINLPTYKVEKDKYNEVKKVIPIITEELEIISENYANVTGKRLFVTPNLFNKGKKISTDKPRKFDIEYSYAFKDADTIQIKIPEGYMIEALPKNVELKNKFGFYTINFKVENNVVEVLRVYERNAARYPATDFEALVKFYDEISKADKARIVFVKKDS